MKPEQIQALRDLANRNDFWGYETDEVFKLFDALEQAQAKIEQLKDAGKKLSTEYDKLQNSHYSQYKEIQRLKAENERYKKALEEIESGKGLSEFLSQNDWAIESDYYAGIAQQALRGDHA